MRKVLFILLVAVFVAGTVQAQVTSAKGSAAIGEPKVLSLALAGEDGWDEVLTTIVQVPQQKELVFDVALQCELYTDTLVRSKGGNKDSSTAEAAIDVRVKVQSINQDGSLGEEEYAHPGEVTFAKRTQELMAKFQGIFQECELYDGEECIQYSDETCLDVEADYNDDGTVDYVTTLDMECLDYEEVQLIQNTINANAFNFVISDLEQGEYRVSVEAKISTDSEWANGGADAKGIVGLGSMVVDEVRFIKGDDGTGM